MNTDTIKRLSHHAARRLLALHYCNSSEALADLPRLREQAGLTPRQYERAFKELQKLGLRQKLGFLTYEDGSICLPG